MICSCIESLLLCEGNTRQGCVVALCSTVRMHVRLSWQELGKWLFVAPCQQKTHIWSSQTMLTFLDFMAEELRARRRELNLDISHKAMIICDMASQHSAKKFAALKRAWVEQHNAVPGLYLSALLVYIYIYRCIVIVILYAMCFLYDIYIYIHLFCAIYLLRDNIRRYMTL